jgi:hypothetical protein
VWEVWGKRARGVETGERTTTGMISKKKTDEKIHEKVAFSPKKRALCV